VRLITSWRSGEQSLGSAVQKSHEVKEEEDLRNNHLSKIISLSRPGTKQHSGHIGCTNLKYQSETSAAVGDRDTIYAPASSDAFISLTCCLLPAAHICRYFVYSEADFEVFRPTGATRCTDGGEIWHRGGDPHFHPHRCNDKGVGPQN